MTIKRKATNVGRPRTERPMMKSLRIYMDPDVEAALRAAAEANDRSVSAMGRLALRQGLGLGAKAA